MAFLLADLSSVRTDELLDFLEREIPKKGWGALDELNMRTWRETARNPDARQVGEAFQALLDRGDDLTPQERERLIALLDGDDAKKSILNFLKANAEIIRKLKKRNFGYRHMSLLQKLAAANRVIRMSVFVHIEDVDKVREFADELLEERGVELPTGQRRRAKNNEES